MAVCILEGKKFQSLATQETLYTLSFRLQGDSGGVMGPHGPPGPKGEPGEPGGGYMVSTPSKPDTHFHPSVLAAAP